MDKGVMGMSLLWNVLTSPARGLLTVFEKIIDAAQQEMESQDSLMVRLLELQISYELGEIEKDEYDQKYQQLIDKMMELQEHFNKQEESGNQV